MSVRGREVVVPTVAALGVAIVVLLIVVLAGNPGGWWPAFAAAVVSAVFATALTLPMLVGSLRLPPTLAGPRVLAVGMLRAMVTLGVAGAAVVLFETPVKATAMMAMSLYFVVLAAETWSASRVVATTPVPAAEPVPPTESQAR